MVERYIWRGKISLTRWEEPLACRLATAFAASNGLTPGCVNNSSERRVRPLVGSQCTHSTLEKFFELGGGVGGECGVGSAFDRGKIFGVFGRWMVDARVCFAGW